MSKKTIYCDGTFDLIHSGHINFFKKCKSLGDILIVGVISDENVKSYKRKPIINLDNRCYMLEHITLIDKVIKNCPFNNLSKQFITDNNIDFVVYASKNGLKEWENHYNNAIDMNIMKYVKYNETISTSEIIKKIKDN